MSWGAAIRNPDLRDSDGLTPLMIAAELGRLNLVGLLLTAGADVFAVEPRMGATALHKAAQSGDAEYPKLVHYNELARGGHFAAWEQPELLAEEIRLTFRHVR